jgi:hypothetical protein
MLIIAIQSTNLSTYVLGKYVRTATSTVMVMIICSGLNINIRQLIKVLGLIFFIHIFSVGLQSLFPQLELPMANFFGFDREASVVTDYSIRKLGCSSSYDTAALISVSSMIFFALRYLVERKRLFLLLSFFSLISTIAISRTGMIIGIICFTLLCILLFFKIKGRERLMPILFLTGGIIVGVIFIMPIVASSTKSFLSDTKYNNIVFSTNDYTKGTLEGLISSHLSALKVPFIDLVFGYGIDPNTVRGKATDIGYVKLIYHIGIIGLIMIVTLYYFFFKKASKIRQIVTKNSNEYLLASFIIWYIALIFISNYKSLEMYSRGSYEILLIMFCTLVNTQFNNSEIFEKPVFSNIE